MKDFTLKLINGTLENLQEFAKNCRKQMKKWRETGINDLADYYEGKARAFEMAYQFIKTDIEMGEDNE